MALSKLEMQQMLREMGVKFNADATYEELKQRLQQENHSLWLKSVAESRSGASDRKRVVVRKRKNTTPLESPAPENTASQATTDNKPADKNSHRAANDHKAFSGPAHHPRAVEKPGPGKPWKAAADGTEPFNRTKKVFESVLKRAKGCCEYCGKQVDSDDSGIELQAHYIDPISEGGEHSIKNMVALCPACVESLATDSSAKDLKELKRKTRSRLYDTPEVVRKKKTAKRQYFPSR